MKTARVVVAAMLLGAANAGAGEIAGKWGIGAGIFSGGGEASLIYGHSNRTAWVFDVVLSGVARDRTAETSFGLSETFNTNDWRIDAGPALRRYTRPSSEFSPYGDLFVSFGYGQSHSGGDTPASDRTRVAVSTGLAFGLEYFTRWHCSIAADTGVLTVRWERFSEDLRSFSGSTAEVTDDRFSGAIGISPRLILRAYF